MQPGMGNVVASPLLTILFSSPSLIIKAGFFPKEVPEPPASRKDRQCLIDIFPRFVDIQEKVGGVYSKVAKQRVEKLLLSGHKLIIKTPWLLEGSEIGHKCST